MGFWGYGLYQNDVSLDVRDDFEKLFNAGKTVKEITDILIEDYKSLSNDLEEYAFFWLALADTQCDHGMLLPFVKEKALYHIKELDDSFNQKTVTEDVFKRRKVLNELKQKLNLRHDVSQKTFKKRTYICQWKTNDVFAYRMESDLAKERGFFGRYLLIQKIDEGTWYPGHIVPIVYVKITADSNLPVNQEQYDKLEYIQIGFTSYEERFWPIDMSRPQEDIAEKSKYKYEVDEYGFLPQYRIMLLNTSKKIIPNNLIYVGNFAKTIRPQIEFVPHSKDNIPDVAWKRFEETFETIMIKNYCGHNLRELSVYSDN